MSGIEIGAVSVILIIGLIYAGLYVPIALGLVSFLGVWIIRANIEKPISLVAQATADTVSGYFFATVPLFVMMGLLVSKSGLGRDIYQVANRAFYRLRGGLGIATVAANAVFASVTGSSIASRCSLGCRCPRCVASTTAAGSPSASSPAARSWAC